MVAKLVAEEGSLKGLILSLEHGEQWVIGRDPDACQLLIEDPAASRRHLLCRSTPEGTILENLSATNPVQVNQEELKEPRLLTNGDLVRIGSNLFRFYSEGEARLFEEEGSNGAGQPPTNGEKVQAAESHEEPSPEEGEEDDIDIPEEEHEEIFTDDHLADEFENAVPKRRDTIFDEEAAEAEALLADIDFDLIETGRWLLKVIGGPNSGAEFTMKSGGTYLVGSDPANCDVVFNDTSVSRQHARLTITEDDEIFIEDLRSRNGTLLDGHKLEGKKPLETNVVVNLGTSAFVVFDKEGEMHTIISPLLPSIVKVLQKEEPHESKEASETAGINEEEKVGGDTETEGMPQKEPEKPAEKSKTTLTAFILIAIITGTFVLMGIGMVTLFQTKPVETHQVADINRILAEALAPFPGVEYTYNKTTGTLMIVGHVLTDNAKRQLLYNLQGLSFIKNIDVTGIVIDEKVWQELNPILAKNPSWHGVTLQASAPGQFVLTGYLKTRDQMASLVDYMTSTFPYLDRLTYRVVVEEDVVKKVKLDLTEAGMSNVTVTLNNGDLTLQGAIPMRLHDKFEEILNEITNIPGVRNVQDFVTEISASKSAIDVTDRYLVTGVSQSGGNVSVIIDGRIVSKGDILDGMTITKITPQAVYLTQSGTDYRIDLRP